MALNKFITGSTTAKKNDIDFLIIKADRRDAQVVMDLRDLLDILLDRHTKTINQIRVPQMAKWGH